MRPTRPRSVVVRAVTVVSLAFGAICSGVGAPSASAAVINVNCNQTSLGTAIQGANPGDTLKVSGTCHGQFVVDRDLTIQGAPAATINGDGGGRPLIIFGFSTVHLRNLVVTGGVATDGGGILFGGGLLTLDHVTVRGNSATGGLTPGQAHGGGIWVSNPGFLEVTDSTITDNHVTVSGQASEAASGGGIDAEGSVTITNSTISGNSVAGTSSDNAGQGSGGGVNVFGTLTIDSSRINNNHAGGTGPDFGIGRGGGVAWVPQSHDRLTIVDSTFANNQNAVNTNGEAIADGGGLWVFSDEAHNPINVRGSVFDGNVVSGISTTKKADVSGGAISLVSSSQGAELHMSTTQITDSHASATGATTADVDGGAVTVQGGSGNITRSSIVDSSASIHAGIGVATGGGGGVFVRTTDPFSIVSSTIDGNTMEATSNATGVSIAGGGIQSTGFDPLTIRNTTVSNNRLTATAGNASAESLGGGVSLEGTGTLTPDLVINSTITKNTAEAVNTNGPSAAGGGMAVFDKKLALKFVTVARNEVTGTGTNAFFGGGGLYLETGTDTHLQGNVVALNTALTGVDCIGIGASDGFNLFGDTTDCAITTVASDQTNPVPKLGSLAANGGPTKTVALLLGSPALNKMPKAACQAVVKKDQRGTARPQGLKCDEGAFERKP